MPVNKRRSDMEIIRDILSMDQMGLTELRHSANLSYTQLQKYLAFLEHWGLIVLLRRGARAISFRVTAKGHRVLKLLDELFLMLESSNERSAGHGGSHLATF